jgi:hypothetical protein
MAERSKSKPTPEYLGGNSDELYHFAYGSNMNPEQLAAHGVKPKVVAVAKLSGHQLVFFGHSVIWDGAEETLILVSGHDVWGVVYELSSADRDRLDDWQDARLDGSGSHFHSPSTVTGVSGNTYKVLLYKKDAQGEPRKPSQEYLNFIVNGAVARDLPAAYIEKLRAMESRKAGFVVPRPRKSVRELVPAGDCSGCGDAGDSVAPSPIISINLGSGSQS